MKIDTTTCWYDNDKCPEQMIHGAIGRLWPILENSDHFPVLNELMNSTSEDCVSLLDIGCGAAEMSRVFPDYFYTGADLKNIINNVSLKMHPNKSFVSFDIYEDNDSEYISSFDIVVMNAFIDVLEYPVYGLDKILKHASKYVILHRQEVDTDTTRVIKNPSYGGVTFHSIINREELESLLKDHSFEVVKEIVVEKNSKSFLLRKKE